MCGVRELCCSCSEGCLRCLETRAPEDFEVSKVVATASNVPLPRLFEILQVVKHPPVLYVSNHSGIEAMLQQITGGNISLSERETSLDISQ